MRIWETGTVVEVRGGRASVRIRPERSEDCRECTACRAFGQQEFVLSVETGTADLKPGDEVRLEVPLPSPWRGIVLVLAIPLVALMVGLLAGNAWQGFHEVTGLGPDWGGIVLGLGLGLAAFMVAVVEERRFARRHRPRILEVRRT